MVIGIDVGGTKAEYGLVDMDGNILRSGHIKVKPYADRSYQDFLSDLGDGMEALIRKGDHIEGIGIGCPNGNYHSGCMENAANITFLESRTQLSVMVPFCDYLSKRFGVPARLTNDANAAAIGEMVYGDAKGLKDFIMITVGTGLGSGFVTNGELIYGHDGFAGELGHAIVVPNGRPCNCGRNGCLEKYVSAGGLLTTYHLLEEENNNFNHPCYHAKDVGDLANAGNPLALKAFDMMSEILGFALANTAVITSPKTIFFFGGVMNSADYILPATKKYMEENMLFVFKDKIDLRLSALQHLNAGILGAAALAQKD